MKKTSKNPRVFLRFFKRLFFSHQDPSTALRKKALSSAPIFSNAATVAKDVKHTSDLVPALPGWVKNSARNCSVQQPFNPLPGLTGYNLVCIKAFCQRFYGISKGECALKAYLKILDRIWKRELIIHSFTELSGKIRLFSFHPEMVFFPNICINLQSCLCDVLAHASAQLLDFFDLRKKSSFLN